MRICSVTPAHRSGALLLVALAALGCRQATVGSALGSPPTNGFLSCGVESSNPHATDPCSTDAELLDEFTLEREPGPPAEVDVVVSVPSNGLVCIRVENMGATAVWIDVDGEQVKDPGSFNPFVIEVTETVSLRAGPHTVSARLAGIPGTSIHVEIRFRPLEAADVMDDVRDIIEIAEADAALRFAALPPALSAEVVAAADALSERIGIPGVGISPFGAVRSLSGIFLRIPVAGVDAGTATTPEEAAIAFLSEHPLAYGLVDPTTEVVVERVKPSSEGGHYVFLRQVIGPWPALENLVVLHLYPDLSVHSSLGQFLPGCEAPPAAAAVDEAGAIAIAEADAGSVVSSTVGGLGVVDPHLADLSTPPIFAWKIIVDTSFPARDRVAYYIDAIDGTILGKRSILDTHFEYEVWYGSNWDASDDLHPCDQGGPGVPDAMCITATAQVATSCSIPQTCPFAGWIGDAAAGFFNTVFTYQYLNLRLGRDGWTGDDDPTPRHRMIVNVNYDTPCFNAFWHGDHADISEGLVCQDVVTHEFIHGVEGDEGVLGTAARNNGLKEGYADALASLAERFIGIDPEWTMATGVGCDPSCGLIREYDGPDALRSLEDPPSVCNQKVADGATVAPERPPDHWSNFLDMDDLYEPPGLLPENEDEHYNASIPGKLTFLLGREPFEGAVTHGGISVTGIGEELTSLVMYESLLRIGNGAEVHDLRAAFLDVAFVDPTTAPILNFFELIAAGEAFDAVGFWTEDYLSGIQTDDKPSILTLSPSERWILFRNPGPGLQEISLATLGGPIVLTSLSSPPVGLGIFSAHGPSAVLFEGNVWVFFVDDTGKPSYRIVPLTGDPLTNPPVQVPNSLNTDGVAAVVTSFPVPEVTIIYRDVGVVVPIGFPTPLTWQKTDATEVWTVPGTSPAASDLAPAAAVVGPSTVYVAYSVSPPPPVPGVDPDPLLGSIAVRLFFPDGGVWSAAFGQDSEFRTGDNPFATDVPPAIAVSEGLVHVAGARPLPPGFRIVTLATWVVPGTSGETWTRIVGQERMKGTTTPFVHLDRAGADDGRLYLWHSMAPDELVFRTRRGAGGDLRGVCPPAID